MSLAEPPVRVTRGDLRRQAIIDIARTSFLSEGYAATSMSAIGARAGGSKATLYTYYPSKADLFAAVIQEMCERTRHELRQAGDPDAETSHLMTRFGRRYVRIMLSDEVIALHRLVVSEAVRFPELGEVLDAVGPRYGKAVVADAMASLAERGELRLADPARAAGHFLDLCLSGLYRRRLWNLRSVPTEAEMDENVDVAVSVFLAAYGPDQAP